MTDAEKDKKRKEKVRKKDKKRKEKVRLKDLKKADIQERRQLRIDFAKEKMK